MSIEEHPSPEIVPQGNPGTADGSPPEGTPRTQEIDGKGTDNGVEPESGQDGDGKDPHAEVTRLQREIEAVAQENARYADLVAKIDASPYGAKLFEHLNGRDPGDEDDDVAAYVAKFWPKTIVDQETGQSVPNRTHEVMAGLVAEIRKDIARELEAKFAPQIQGVQRTLASTKFERTVADRGLDLRRPDVQQFVRQMERDPESGSAFKKLREHKPAAAASWLAAEFSARNGVRTSNAAARERVEMSKGAKLNGSSPRGGATAARQFVYNPRDPQNTANLMKFFEAGGKREGIVVKK